MKITAQEIMKVDFKKLDRDEINNFIRQANEALSEYDNRSKTKVYSVFIPFIGYKKFIDKQNALELVRDLILDESVFDGSGDYKIGISYLTDAELAYCQDHDDYLSNNDWNSQNNGYPE